MAETRPQMPRVRLHYLLFLFLVLIRLDQAFSQSTVKTLPGYPGNLPFKLETGYIGVGEKEEVQLFYYFIESENDPRRDPLVLWLTGGPGCSGFSGLVYEIGPLAFDLENFDGSLPSLLLNPYSWTKVANIIFIDSPVGTGFSYATTSEGYYSSDTKSAKDCYTFMQKWLSIHPMFIKNPLYISGDSYGGKIVPMVAVEIAKGNEAGNQPRMLLQGYSVGNSITNLSKDDNEKIPYAHRMALISDEYYELAKSSCRGEYVNPDPNNILCILALQLVKQCTDLVYTNHILEPTCLFITPKPNNHTWGTHLLDDPVHDLLFLSKQDAPKCRNFNYVSSHVWMNDETVREALYIRKGTIGDWKRCNLALKGYEYDVESVFRDHQLLNEKGFQTLAYSGDHDMFLPYLSTLRWIRELNLTIDSAWRPWTVDGQGAGHTAPEYKPKETNNMLKKAQTWRIQGLKCREPGRIICCSWFSFYSGSTRHFRSRPSRPCRATLETCLSNSKPGPLAFDLENFDGSLPSLLLNPYSWTKVANIIFIDSPVGTGFSYANTSQGYYSSDTKSAKDCYTFMQKWLLIHPMFIKNPLYISGDSYGGKIVPMVAMEIAKGNEAGNQPRMLLQGYSVGNSITNISKDDNEKIPYAHRMALISDEYYELAKSSCHGEYVNPDPQNILCILALQLVKQCTDLIWGNHILEPKCLFSTPQPNDHMWGSHLLEDPVDNLLFLSKQDAPKCRNNNYVSSYVWMNDETVREALYIRKGTIGDWKRCNKTLKGYESDVESVFRDHQLLNEKGFQTLAYSGDHDLTVPYLSTLRWIRELNLTIDSAWRPWTVDGQIAGVQASNAESPVALSIVSRCNAVRPVIFAVDSRDPAGLPWKPAFQTRNRVGFETNFPVHQRRRNEEVQLFYYFIDSENDPRRDPLVLWLTGGPGCSGSSGLIYEIGPLAFDLENFDGSFPSLILNPYSWTKIANIIFIDSPFGTGFLYANTSKGYYSSDTKSTKDIYTFMQKCTDLLWEDDILEPRCITPKPNNHKWGSDLLVDDPFPNVDMSSLLAEV
ncbi:serine carboxypeptidase [Striga asiatica]|uniref:Serine carboxypeptidase n=1 Tax=Striga asiatica TaxID=4170 RepID=A0A5A7PW78_STRAF|nr:serine carboxypeptidase [Striga asiatica]